MSQQQSGRKRSKTINLGENMPQEKTLKTDLQAQKLEPTRTVEQSSFRMGQESEKGSSTAPRPSPENESAKEEAVEDLLSLLSRI